MVYSVNISVPHYPILDLRYGWKEKNEIEKKQLKLIVTKRTKYFYLYEFIHMHM